MKPYVVQSFENDLGKVQSSKIVGSIPASERVVSLSGDDLTINPERNTVYQCGALSRLNVADSPSNGGWVIAFTSGNPPTEITVPAHLIGLEQFTAAANTRYELNVRDSYAVVKGWSVATDE